MNSKPSQSEALAIYNAVIAHLSQHDIPPFSTFYHKPSTPNVLKWCMEASAKPQGTKTIPPDQLILFMFVEKQGQNPDDPTATYWQWERIYQRAADRAQWPKGILSKPRKPRTAKGSRTKTTTEKDAS